MAGRFLRTEIRSIVQTARKLDERVIFEMYCDFAGRCEAAAVMAGANWREADKAHELRRLPDLLERRLGRRR